MQRGLIRSFIRDEGGAISPMYAVGILALVAIAGVGFDYGRVMALDTELQNAADQAALAAATQLDGSDGSMDRAREAVVNALGNQTRFANDRDSDGRSVSIPATNVEFYDGYTVDADTDDFGNVAATDNDAKVVQVTVKPRVVRYALTPLVAAFTGQAIGKAAAKLEDATCNVPPMMFCVPNGTDGNADRSFPTPADVGRALQLHFKSNGKDSPGNPNDTTTDSTVWAPGNFGFLDLDYLPKSGQNSTAGLNSNGFGCTGEPPMTNPGFRTPQGSALNSRFDLYPPPVKQCQQSTGDFCPSANVTKNWVNIQTLNNQTTAQRDAATCAANPSNSWSRYDDVSGVTMPDPGYPTDASFSGPLGNGNWSPDAWIAAAHPGSVISDIPDEDGNGTITRYEAYLWELANPGALLQPRVVQKTWTSRPNGRWNVTLYCAYPQPVNQPAFPSSDTQKDRRILTVAAVDCTSLRGKAQVDILRWVDLFLVRPVNTTASDRNFLTEIKGPGTRPSGDTGYQYFSKRKAVLIR